MAGADSNFEGVARLYGADATPSEHARTHRKIRRTKSRLWAEPLHDCADWRAGRYLEPSLGETRSSAESMRFGVIGISIEVATDGNLGFSNFAPTGVCPRSA
jgi:hypothetical protein